MCMCMGAGTHIQSMYMLGGLDNHLFGPSHVLHREVTNSAC